jgi:hypothetical protein
MDPNLTGIHADPLGWTVLADLRNDQYPRRMSWGLPEMFVVRAIQLECELASAVDDPQTAHGALELDMELERVCLVGVERCQVNVPPVDVALGVLAANPDSCGKGVENGD